MNKKWLIGLFVLFSLPVLVSAQMFNLDIRQGSQQLIDFFVNWAEPFIQAILGGTDSGMMLFEKFLFFIVMVSIVYIALKRVDYFKNQPVVIWVISIIIPILSIRYLPIAWINTLLFEYQVLGVALAGIIPFIIYLYFLHGVSDEPIVRKIGWIFFICVYFGLWSTSNLVAYQEIYFWTMLVAVVFLILDGTIHRYFMMMQLREGGESDKWKHMARIRRDMDQAKRDVDKGYIPKHVGDKIIKQREKDLKRWLNYKY